MDTTQADVSDIEVTFTPGYVQKITALDDTAPRYSPGNAENDDLERLIRGLHHISKTKEQSASVPLSEWWYRVTSHPEDGSSQPVATSNHLHPDDMRVGRELAIEDGVPQADEMFTFLNALAEESLKNARTIVHRVNPSTIGPDGFAEGDAKRYVDRLQVSLLTLERDLMRHSEIPRSASEQIRDSEEEESLLYPDPGTAPGNIPSLRESSAKLDRMIRSVLEQVQGRRNRQKPEVETAATNMSVPKALTTVLSAYFGRGRHYSTCQNCTEADGDSHGVKSWDARQFYKWLSDGLPRSFRAGAGDATDSETVDQVLDAYFVRYTMPEAQKVRASISDAVSKLTSNMTKTCQSDPGAIPTKIEFDDRITNKDIVKAVVTENQRFRLLKSIAQCHYGSTVAHHQEAEAIELDQAVQRLSLALSEVRESTSDTSSTSPLSHDS